MCPAEVVLVLSEGGALPDQERCKTAPAPVTRIVAKTHATTGGRPTIHRDLTSRAKSWVAFGRCGFCTGVGNSSGSTGVAGDPSW
jgi:hypothetical protein